jgi:hypothetical protein
MINHKIIYELYPQVKEIRGDLAYDVSGNLVEYDKDEVQAQIDSIAYKEQRAKQYPSIGDQLDMLWHAIDNGTLNKTSDFYTAIKAVKDAHPKE